MSLADFDKIIIRRKTNQKKKKTRVGLNDLEKEMKDIASVSKTLHSVEKTGNNITLHLKIHLASKEMIILNVLDTTKVKDVIQQLKEKVGVTLNLFYLCEVREDNNEPIKFFNSQRTLHQEKITDTTPLGFRTQWIAPFKQKYNDKNVDYLYNCLRTAIVETRFPVERKIANVLASVMIQMNFGNYREQEATLIDITKYCNSLVIQNYGKDNMVRSCLGVHEKLKGQTNLVTLKQSFLQMIQRAHSYGATMFEAVLSGKKVHVGVVYDGIIVYLSDLIEDLQFYPIDSIRSVYSTGDAAVIFFNNNKNLQIKTGKPEKLVTLVSGYFYLNGNTSADKRKEIVFLTNRLSHFHETIQLSAADAYLDQYAPKKFTTAIVNAIKQGSNLTTVNFASSNLGLTQFTVFAESVDRTFKSRGGKDVEETFNVQELILADNTELGKMVDFAKACCLVLKSPIALKRIDLSNLGITEEVGKELVDGFRACNSLEYLNLSNNPFLGSDSLQAILRSINKNALFRLDIRNCGVKRQDATQIIRVIQDFPNLQQLIIKNNAIGASGTEFAKLVSKLKKLQVLDVRRCGLPKDQIIGILKGLSDNRVLKDLRLSGNEGVNDVIGYIHDATEEGKVVKFPPISRLDIAGEELTASSAKKVVKLMQRPSCHFSAIDVSGAKLKSDISKICETLLSYEKSQTFLSQLSCNNCLLSDASISYIVNYVSSTNKLTKFKIGYNTSLFKKGNYNWISDMIRGNKTLKNLHLSGLGLHAEQFVSITDSIANHPCLLKLSLDGNPVGSYLHKIGEMLVLCQHLTTLRLRNLEGVTKSELADWLNNSLPQNLSLEKISIHFSL
ncbi:FERM domain-containing protein [Entamoeba marina]